MDEQEITSKTTEPQLVVLIEGKGKIPDFNKDVDRLFEYLYENNLQSKIAGPLIGIFYSEFGGKYLAAVPLEENIEVNEKIKMQTLPGIECITVLHKGSYRQLKTVLTN